MPNLEQDIDPTCPISSDKLQDLLGKIFANISSDEKFTKSIAGIFDFILRSGDCFHLCHELTKRIHYIMEFKKLEIALVHSCLMNIKTGAYDESSEIIRIVEKWKGSHSSNWNGLLKRMNNFYSKIKKREKK